MSRLVTQADRSALPRRDDEPTGEVETLVGRIDPREMGSKVQREKPAEKKKRPVDEIEALERRAKRQEGQRGYAYADVLAATEDLEGLTYRPRTRETRQTYELILSFVHQALVDQPQEVIRSAADMILQTLKDDAMKDFDRKTEIESILGKMEPESFAQLVGLGKKITDYNADDDMQVDNEGERRDGQIDDEMGVAVVFDEDEEEDNEEGGDNFEVGDGENDDDDVDEDEEMEPAQDDASDAGSDIVIGQQTTVSKKDDGKLKAHDIDAFWLQRLVSTEYSDPHTAQAKAVEVMSILSSESNMRDVENALMELFEFDKFELVGTLTKNRDLIVWCTRLARADADEKMNVEVAMREKGLNWILKELRGERGGPSSATIDAGRKSANTAMDTTSTVLPNQTLDLESMIFQQGSHLMSNKKCTLPQGSFKRAKKGYEEIHIPISKPKPPVAGERVVAIGDLPPWTHAAFPGAKSLNRIQSQVYPVAFGQDDNILLCAPTGAGKTNCAMLTILNEMSKYRDEETSSIDLNAFKVVYVAPMKALVQEMVGNFSSRLSTYGVQTAELTGDRQLTKAQIAETQIIVTTPEKWDVITRKNSDTSYTNLVTLLIIDEIHLLHDDRGPVLESIIARTIRRMKQTQMPVRLVGLSATLPNYEDVATFLRVNPDKGLFYFDSSYRPCPLKQEFIGITEKKAFKRLQVMNEVAYEKVLEHAGKNQVLVFTHSRKETAKTALAIRDQAIEKETITQFLRTDSAATREILREEAEQVKDNNLRELLPYGFAIHHAGMTRFDRSLVEDLFANGHIQVLVSTATLAWGVNLPAHAVIIKGTQIYSPEKGKWVELSPQDVLQMLGRAGRPQYDTFGEGIIITAHAELQYYLSLLNQQLPIESQFVSKLADNLNAEVVLGTIRTRDEAVEWLGYTYLYVRMLRNPGLYNIGIDALDDDTHLVQKRADLVHTAASILDKCNLVKYDRASGRLVATELGRIASHFYISHTSMATYNLHLKPMLSHIDLFRVFALSDEFKFIPVREEEKLELAKLLERVPIPVKESIEEPTAKINVLLQAYISQLKLDGFALVADMVYVTQSAQRILRAIFEMALRRGWAQLTRRALDLCKMVEKRMWSSMSPLRQFPTVPAEVIKRVERKDFAWSRYFDLNPPEIGELIGIPKAGKLVHKLVHQFPKLDVRPSFLPITRSLLRVDVSITPDFQWDDKVHGFAEAFWIMVEDADGEQILYSDSFILRSTYAEQEHYVAFTVPMFDPLPPNYFLSVVSDRWLHSETRTAIAFTHLILPEKFPPPTPLLDLQPLPVSAFGNKEFQAIYTDIESFNKIQTQVFSALYTTDDNVLIGAPNGSGKTICAEFALLRLWSKPQAQRAVCIEPYQEMVDQRVVEWQRKFGNVQGGKEIVKFTGETSADLKLLEKGDVIICTPTQWDIISRRWKQRKNVQTLGLFIADEVHLIGGSIGPTYEVIVSRIRYMSSQTEHKVRIVGLSTSLANARDIAEWMRVPSQATFNFHPRERPVPLEIHIQSYSIPHFPSLMIAMARPAYTAITTMAEGKPVIVFVPSRRQSRMTVDDLLTYAAADDQPDRFLNTKIAELQEYLDRLDDKGLAESLAHGIAYYHEALTKSDKALVQQLFALGAIQVMVASRDTCWSLQTPAHMVIIMGAQYYEGREHRYVDYSVPEVLQMMGRACRPRQDALGRCVIMCQANKKDFYKKFLNEGLPVESHLQDYMHDHFNAEIVTKTIENKQDAVDYLTWTFMYRRLTQNPNYYNLSGVSHRHLSDHLSELVETTLQDLVKCQCVSIEDDMDVTPNNLGMIAAYYNISYQTVDVFSLSLTDKTKLKGLLEIVSTATEFEDIPIRNHEDSILRRLYDRLPVKYGRTDFAEPSFKTNILLQAHFSRLQLPPDLAADQALVLGKVLNLLSACVDVMSSNAYLNAIGAMELSQMCVQAMWDRDSPLKQVPFFTTDVIERFKAAGMNEVFELQDMEDVERTKLLQMETKQLREVAKFVNEYPDVNVEFEVEDEQELHANSPIVVNVTLEREVDEDEEVNQSVIAPFFPNGKMQNWWVVIGEQSSKQLLCVRRVTVGRRLAVKLDFTVEKAGKHDLKVYLICDSYVGCDREHDLEITCGEALEEDEEENEEEDSDE